MTNKEFKYWLRGYFEISNGAPSLNPTQVGILQKHIALVKEIDGDLCDFITWLNSVLEIAAMPSMKIDLVALADIIEKRLGSELQNVTNCDEDEEAEGKTKDEVTNQGESQTGLTPLMPRHSSWSHSDRTYC